MIDPTTFPGRGKVAILRTRPETVLDDYARVMRLAGYQAALPPDRDTFLKINISWQTWYPACSSAPWQVEGVIKTLLDDGYHRESLMAAHNRTVVVDAYVGERNNGHRAVVDKYGIANVHLYEPDVPWVRYEPKTPLLVLDKVYPEGILLPQPFFGRNIIQLPTVKCVHPDTEVVLGDGRLVRAGDLVEERLRLGGMPLMDEDGDIRLPAVENLVGLASSGEVSVQPTLYFWRTPVNGQKLWRVRTRTGRDVTVSSEHPFLTPTGWRKASALEPGARIAIPRKISLPGTSQPLPLLDESLGMEVSDLDAISFRPGRKHSAGFQREMALLYLSGRTLQAIADQFNLPWQTVQRTLGRYNIPMRGMKHWVRVPERTSPDFWRWMGYFLAEGWVQPMRTTCRFWWTNSDLRIREDFFQLTETLFGLQPTSRPGTNDCYVDSVHLGQLFDKLGLPIPLHAASKRVPPLLFQCSDEEIAALLSGYLDGDGAVGKRDGLHVTTKSERLAREVQYLLTRLGVVGFRRKYWSRATNSDSPARLYHQISVYSDDLVTLAQWIRLRSEHKQRRLDTLVERRQRGKHPSNWDTIPVDREQFRTIRQGLRLTQGATGRPGSVQAIEDSRSTPTRQVVQHFVALFQAEDRAEQYAAPIGQMAFMAGEAIAWDHITAIEEIESDTPYLYDFTMATEPNFVGNGMFLHNTHVFTTITGAMKNAFGGLLNEKRHWTHAVIHETVVDLLAIQQEIHSGLFAVMDGTFAGDGPGPRAMRWHEKDVILASADQVAIDAISAKLQGFNPLDLKFIRLAHERGLGVGDPREIELVGEPELAEQAWGFIQEDTFASKGQKLIYHGPLKPLEKPLLQSPLVPWSYVASRAYHDAYWYPRVGHFRVQDAYRTKWGRLFKSYVPGVPEDDGYWGRFAAWAGLALLGVAAGAQAVKRLRG